MDKNNVLFVGNGIDLLNGYKTDYVSFLLSEKEQYKNLFMQAIKNKVDANKLVKINSHTECTIDLYKYIQLLYINPDPNALKKELEKYNIKRTKNIVNNTTISDKKKLNINVENSIATKSKLKEDSIFSKSRK